MFRERLDRYRFFHDRVETMTWESKAREIAKRVSQQDLVASHCYPTQGQPDSIHAYIFPKDLEHSWTTFNTHRQLVLSTPYSCRS